MVGEELNTNMIVEVFDVLQDDTKWNSTDGDVANTKYL
jgi:hypothetical protein